MKISIRFAMVRFRAQVNSAILNPGDDLLPWHNLKSIMNNTAAQRLSQWGS